MRATNNIPIRKTLYSKINEDIIQEDEGKDYI
jgi:hypothetical protein